MTGIKIAPSILAADFARLGEQVQEAVSAGAEMIHIDVMDGQFVPNITMGPLIVEAVRRVTDVTLDVHLMIVQPENMIEAFAKAGANSISVHIEASPNLHRTLTQIRALGCKPAVAINPHTPASALTEVLYLLDMVNVMTVNPGFGGQELIMEMLPKIRQLVTMSASKGYNFDIEIDGGVSEATANMLVDAGANVLVVGSGIFRHPDGVAEGFRAIRDAVNE